MRCDRALIAHLILHCPLAVQRLVEERHHADPAALPFALQSAHAPPANADILNDSPELGGVDIFARDYAPPGGETGPEFDARVDRAWDAIRARAELVAGRLAVVTHGLVCASLTARHLAADDPVVLGSWRNTSVTVVEGVPPWRVLRLNCTAHLEEDAGPGGGAV